MRVVGPQRRGALPLVLQLESFAAYLDAGAADPVTWGLVLMAPEGTPEVLRDRIRSARAAVASVLAGAGGLSSPDPPLTGLMRQALAHEAARLLRTDPEGFPRDRLLAHPAWLIGALTG